MDKAWSPKSASSDPRLILLADDNSVVREATSRLLR